MESCGINAITPYFTFQQEGNGTQSQYWKDWKCAMA